MNYPSIRIEGAIISPELFDRLDELPGQKPSDFGLSGSVTVKDEIARAWADAQDYWRIFRRKLDTLPENSFATTETRNLWISPLLSLLGYQLEYQQRGPELNAKAYPISHRAANRANTPVHVVGYRDQAGLDRKPERSGGPRMSAHALVQEYLNLSDQLYGVVTNGRLIRLLRDSSRLVKLTYLEFDLDRIFNDGLYADFALLYRLLHASRLPGSAEATAESLIERYHLDSVEAGARIRDGLSFAVEKTLQDLANGFLSHRHNDALRAAIASGRLTAPAYYQHVLRLIYRLLFLFVIEERDLVHPKDARAKRDLYYRYYSLQRLRGLSKNRYLFNPRHDDAWFATRACFALFESEGAGAKLGISPLAGRLFHPESIGPLREAHLDNATLLASFDELCSFEHPDTHQRVSVNYGALATEEFGSVYERLLELHPVFLTDGATPRFSFKQAAGNERKTTGSYYTPSSLVECLLDSALEPVVRERLAGKTGEAVEQAILSIRVCDPACGSGHFLIAAGNRLARHLAIQRSGAEEPSPADRRHALRDVIGHCLYGVDINPMSVELCKVTLWIEATEPGKPLSFLDHHIQCGNSLLGVTPGLLADGLPDDAFKPIAGDDKAVCTEAKKRNKEERRQIALFHGTDTVPWERLGALPAAMLEVDQIRDDTPAGLQAKEERYAALVRSTGYLHSRFLADAWCAAFVWKKTKDHPYPITNDVLRKIERNPHDCAPWMRDEIQRLRDQYQFFHWHLAFPEVFPLPGKGQPPQNKGAGWNGGFDVMLGNPPWERPKPEPAKYFAASRPDIADAQTSAVRDKLLAELQTDAPEVFARWAEYERFVLGCVHFQTGSGNFPLSAVGKFNLGNTFVERSRQLLAPHGRSGQMNVSGLATDDSGKELIADLMQSRTLVSFYDFENREGLFPAIHRSYKFSAITVAGSAAGGVSAADFVFFAGSVQDLQNPERHVEFTADDIRLLNPISGNCPIFRERRQAELVKTIYRRAELRPPTHEVLWDWDAEPTFLFVMSDHSDLFATREELGITEFDASRITPEVNAERWLPLYESKMFHQFAHRWTSLDTEGTQHDFTDELLRNPTCVAVPRYWMRAKDAARKLGELPHRWLVAVREVTNATNERTTIAATLPKFPVGHNAQVFVFKPSAPDAASFVACLNSFVFDFAARTKVGGSHLSSFILRQLPVLPARHFAEPCAWAGQPAPLLRDWLLPRVLELTYTAWDLEPFARDCGWSGPPFVWDEERRFQLRCELDAAYFHLYGLNQADAAYILETFPIVRRKDEAAHGTYRTKETILAVYDQLAECKRTSTAFVSALNPPPGDLRACHPPRSGLPAVPPLETKTEASTEASSTKEKSKAKAKVGKPQIPDELGLGLDLFGRTATAPTGPDFSHFEQAYPATSADQLVCSIALEFVEWRQSLSSDDHLDGLILATHPDLCRVLAPQSAGSKIDALVVPVKSDLAAIGSQGLKWTQCVRYLAEHRKALTVQNTANGRPISKGPQFDAVRASLLQSTGGLAAMALTTLDQIRKLQATNSLNPTQLAASSALTQLHAKYALA